jgi:hypothetical protein
MKKSGKVEKVQACLELLADSLSDAKTQEEAQAYQIVAHAMFTIDALKQNRRKK